MRARYTVAGKQRRKKVLERAKGFNGGRKCRIKLAKQSVMKAMAYEYRDRRNKKRDFRRLWITRISAFVQAEGMRYSEFIGGLTKAGVAINRKVLSNLAIEDPEAMRKYVEIAKSVAVK